MESWSWTSKSDSPRAYEVVDDIKSVTVNEWSDGHENEGTK